MIERALHVAVAGGARREAHLLAVREEVAQLIGDGRGDAAPGELRGDGLGGDRARRQLQLGGEIVGERARDGVVERRLVAGTERALGGVERAARLASGAREARVAGIAVQAPPAAVVRRRRASPREQRHELQRPEERAPLAARAERAERRRGRP